MKSNQIKFAAANAGLLALMSSAGFAMAADDISVSPENTAAAAGAVAGGFAGLIAAFAGAVVILGIIGLVYLIIWIWALFDVTHRKFSDKSTKSTWTWLVILSWPLPIVVAFIPGISSITPVLSIIGLIIIIVYLISIRKRGTKK